MLRETLIELLKIGKADLIITRSSQLKICNFSHKNTLSKTSFIFEND